MQFEKIEKNLNFLQLFATHESKKKGKNQELTQSNPTITPFKPKGKETHIQTDKRSRKTRTANRIKSSSPNRWPAAT